MKRLYLVQSVPAALVLISAGPNQGDTRSVALRPAPKHQQNNSQYRANSKLCEI
jgi:hypothetical protein